MYNDEGYPCNFWSVRYVLHLYCDLLKFTWLTILYLWFILTSTYIGSDYECLEDSIIPYMNQQIEVGGAAFSSHVGDIVGEITVASPILMLLVLTDSFYDLF